jgi:hypothetical protein
MRKMAGGGINSALKPVTRELVTDFRGLRATRNWIAFKARPKIKIPRFYRGDFLCSRFRLFYD